MRLMLVYTSVSEAEILVRDEFASRVRPLTHTTSIPQEVAKQVITELVNACEAVGKVIPTNRFNCRQAS